MTMAFWKAAAIRAAKTFLQVILAVWTAGTVITEVDWRFVLLSAVSAALYSFLTSILAGLPEVDLQDTLNEYDEYEASMHDEDEDEEDEEEGEE